jgi:hypothetical protein
LLREAAEGSRARSVRRGLNNVINYLPERSVAKLNVGDRIALTAADFERLAAGFPAR